MVMVSLGKRCPGLSGSNFRQTWSGSPAATQRILSQIGEKKRMKVLGFQVTVAISEASNSSMSSHPRTSLWNLRRVVGGNDIGDNWL